MDSFLVFDTVSKRFGDQIALDGVSLALRKGELFSLLGPSGCGKTTLLRIASGFERPDSGRVLLAGKDITDLPPNKRNLNTVFQNYALFPHLTVWDNIAFGLTIAGLAKATVREEVTRMLALTHLEKHAHKKPAQLSGGQRQRTAIARALVNKPEVLLLDEPLAALDLKLRQLLMLELIRLHKQVGTTFLYVTHDQDEALGSSDRLAVLHEGRVEQVGTPSELYRQPQTSFVAGFIGDANFFDGTVSRLADAGQCEVSTAEFGSLLLSLPFAAQVGAPVRLRLRPEKLELQLARPENRTGFGCIEGSIAEMIYLGSFSKYWVVAGASRIAVSMVHSQNRLPFESLQSGAPVWVTWNQADCTVVGSHDAK